MAMEEVKSKEVVLPEEIRGLLKEKNR